MFYIIPGKSPARKPKHKAFLRLLSIKNLLVDPLNNEYYWNEPFDY